MVKHQGIKLPEETLEDFGMAILPTLYPAYNWKLILVASILMLLAVAFVSYLPPRKIASINPKDVIAGRE